MGPAARYGFRPATAVDLPMLRLWLETPEVRRWWGDPAVEEGLLREGLDDPFTTMLIVTHDGAAFAYAQHYPVHAWPQPHLAALPPGTRAIDAFIGIPAMIGRGHGAAFLRLLAAELRRRGAPAVAIDPVLDNVRARRAYARAGFADDKIVETREGKAMLMLFASPPDGA